MGLQVTGQAQPGILLASQKSGSGAAFPTGWNTEPLVSELLPRFSHLTQAGVVFSTGMQLTSINAATFTTADALSGTLATAATSTPIVALYNPLSNNNVNCHVLQAQMSVVVTALTATGCGGFVWVVYQGQNAITVGSQATPVSHKTLLAAGSNCKGLSGLALTGLTTTGVYLETSQLNGGNVINVTETSVLGMVPLVSSMAVELIDGAIVVPPGGILGLFCSTTPVAHSATASMLWAELPV
jgi:hypothetical protein